MTRIVWRIFGARGGIFGVWKWLPIAPSNYGHKRVGTDGAVHGRYSAGSAPLIASGNYRASHKRIEETPTRLVWGSDMDSTFVRWIQNASPAGLNAPRVAMPDVNNQQFKDGVQRINNEFMTQVMIEAKRESG